MWATNKMALQLLYVWLFVVTYQIFHQEVIGIPSFASAVTVPSRHRPSISSISGALSAQKEREKALLDRDSKSNNHLSLLAVNIWKRKNNYDVFQNSSDFEATPIRAQRLSFLSKGMKNALASYIATLLAKIALQPFDTIKTVQQIQKSPKLDASSLSSESSKSVSVVATGIRLVRERGLLKGLWAGTWVSAFGAAPSVAVYFGVFSVCKARLAPLFPLSRRYVAVALAAAVSNSVAAVFRVPYEVFKQRLQSGAHSSLRETVLFTITQEKIFGIFGNGRLASQILRDVPYAVLTAVLYDTLQVTLQKHAQNKKKKTSKWQQMLVLRSEWVDAVSGAVAGGLSTLLTTPLDVVKTRLMASAHSEYGSVGAAMTGIWRQEGVKGFFRGGKSRLLHKVPGNALFFACYELLRFVLGAVDTRSEQ